MNSSPSELSTPEPLYAAPASPVTASSPIAGAGRTRLGALDSLRGIAALGVVLLHLTTDFQRDFAPRGIASVRFPYGAYGVHLFFLISGFVILMTAEKARRPRDFVISRFSRLYPPYWIAVLLTTAVLIIAPVDGTLGPASLLRRALVSLTMFQSWLGIGSVDSVYWTLQVEMSFYLILLALIWRRAVHWALPVMSGLVVLALIDHLLVPRPWSPAYAYLRQILFLETAYLFTAGMVIYRARNGFKPVYALILLLCIMCPATANYFPNTPRIDASIAAMLVLLVYFATQRDAAWMAWPPLTFLGGISYSLYLTHHWVGLSFLKHMDRYGMNPDLALLLVLVLCLVLATAMTRWVERPSLHWLRDRLGNARRIREPRS